MAMRKKKCHPEPKAKDPNGPIRFFASHRMTMLLLAMTILGSSAHAHTWKKIADGVSYTKLGAIHAFQIDPKKFRLSIATAKESGLKNSTARELAKKTKAILAINGGFFSTENKSIGLLIRQGDVLNPLHPTTWWAVFYLSEKKPAIVLPASFQKSGDMEMAVQAGPRLVVDGKIPALKPSEAKRSGIGIRTDGHIVIAASESELSIEEFAQTFQKSEEEGGLGCLNALNLDGGGSTQIYFNWKEFELDQPGTSFITNAVTVFPRY